MRSRAKRFAISTTTVRTPLLAMWVSTRNSPNDLAGALVVPIPPIGAASSYRLPIEPDASAVIVRSVPTPTNVRSVRNVTVPVMTVATMPTLTAVPSITTMPTMTSVEGMPSVEAAAMKGVPPMEARSAVEDVTTVETAEAPTMEGVTTVEAATVEATEATVTSLRR